MDALGCPRRHRRLSRQKSTSQPRVERLRRVLPTDDRKRLLADLNHAPAWMHPTFVPSPPLIRHQRLCHASTRRSQPVLSADTGANIGLRRDYCWMPRGGCARFFVENLPASEWPFCRCRVSRLRLSVAGGNYACGVPSTPPGRKCRSLELPRSQSRRRRRHEPHMDRRLIPLDLTGKKPTFPVNIR